MLGFGTGFGAGGFFVNGEVFCPIVAEFSDDFFYNIITYGADLMLCTVFCAGRFLIGDPFAVAVTLGRNNFLSNKNRVTCRAVLAFGKTGCGAGRFNSDVNDFSMSLGRDFCYFALF